MAADYVVVLESKMNMRYTLNTEFTILRPFMLLFASDDHCIISEGSITLYFSSQISVSKRLFFCNPL